MASIVIIVGRPRTNTSCEALGESYAQGARSSGHKAELFVASKMVFDPILHDGFERVQLSNPI